MSKDLLCDRYGRFYELSEVLAKQGHDMVCVCANYYQSNDAYIRSNNKQWHNFDFHSHFLTGLIKYYKYLQNIIILEKPDVIIGLSDMFHVVISGLLSYKFKMPYIIDLYDNFESYGASKIPGLKTLFYYAVKKANKISVVSPELKKYLLDKSKTDSEVKVIENGVDKNIFHPMEKKTTRSKFKLPANNILIGMAGAISTSRGIADLFSAYLKLKSNHKNLSLVLAGPVDKNVDIPKSSDIYYLGELSYSEIPYFLNTLDVGIIMNKDNSFGQFCFPQKYYEMLACEIPIVAADVGVLHRMLSKKQHILFRPDSVESLISAIDKQINEPVYLTNKVLTWDEQGKKLSSLVERVIN